MVDKIKDWIKSNRAFFLSFMLGLVLFILTALLSDYEVSPMLVMCYYTSFFLILVCFLNLILKVLDDKLVNVNSFNPPVRNLSIQVDQVF